MSSDAGNRNRGAVTPRREAHCWRGAAVGFALLVSSPASALSVSAQCAVPGGGGLVGETGPLFAACANETLASDAWIVIGETRAAANGAEGAMRVRTDVDFAAPGFSVEASASVTETIVIDQPWDGMLELTLSVVGSGASRALFTYAFDPMSDPQGTASHVRVAVGVDAAGSGHYEFSYSEAGGWMGSGGGATADVSANGSSLNGAVSMSFLLPSGMHGLPLELSWSVSFRQWATGFIDGDGTGLLGITLPDGFTYTPSSSAFLSIPVPIPAPLALLSTGLAGIALRSQRNRVR